MSSKLSNQHNGSRIDSIPMETYSSRARRFFFGDDIFVSYARRDADYALSLANELTKQHLSVFLDQWGAPPGEMVPLELIERLKMSTMLVIVGTESGAASNNVMKEVLEFKQTGRPMVPITFVEEQDLVANRTRQVQENLTGTLERANWYQAIAGIPRTFESKDKLKASGLDDTLKPSSQVLSRIVSAQGFHSRSQRLRRSFWLTIASLCVVLLGAGMLAALLFVTLNKRVQKAQTDQIAAEAARDQAEIARVDAENKRLKAMRDLKLAQDEVGVASHDLRVAEIKTVQERTKAENSRFEAEQQGRNASSIETALNAAEVGEFDPDEGIKRATIAYDVAPTPQARRVLRRSLLQSYLVQVIRGENTQLAPGLDSTGQYALEQVNYTLKVRSIETGEVIKSLRIPETIRGSILSFSTAFFSADGRFIIFRSRDDSIFAVFLWEWKAESSPSNPKIFYGTIKEPAAAPSQCVLKQCWVSSPVFSPNGKYMAAATYRGLVWVWEVDSGELLEELVVSETKGIILGFNPADDNCIATGDESGQVLLWNWRSNGSYAKRRVLRWATSGSLVTAIAFDQKGKLLAAALESKRENGGSAITADIMDLASGQTKTLSGHADTINQISFSPNALYVLTGSQDGTARISYWLEPKAQPVIMRHGAAVYGAVFDPTGDYVLTYGENSTPELWKARFNFMSQEIIRAPIEIPFLAALRGHSGKVVAWFSPDGKRILTLSTDRSARIWNADVERTQWTQPWSEGEVENTALSPNADYAVTAGRNGPVLVWDVRDHLSEPTAVLSASVGGGGDDCCVSFSSDGQFVVAGNNSDRLENNNQILRVWNWKQKSLRSKPAEVLIPGGELNAIAVSHNESGTQYVATASGEGYKEKNHPASNAVRIWNLQSILDSKPVVLGHPDPVTAIAFGYGKQSGYLVTATFGGEIRIFDWKNSSQPIKKLHADRVSLYGYTAVALSPDGRYVAAATSNYGFLWNLQTDPRGTAPLKFRTDPGTVTRRSHTVSISFSQDSELMLTANMGEMIRLWDPLNANLLRVIGEYPEIEFPDGGSGASFSQDGRFIIAPYKGTARIYRCPECSMQLELRHLVPYRIANQSNLQRGRD